MSVSGPNCRPEDLTSAIVSDRLRVWSHLHEKTALPSRSMTRWPNLESRWFQVTYSTRRVGAAGFAGFDRSMMTSDISPLAPAGSPRDAANVDKAPQDANNSCAQVLNVGLVESLVDDFDEGRCRDGFLRVASNDLRIWRSSTPRAGSKLSSDSSPHRTSSEALLLICLLPSPGRTV